LHSSLECSNKGSGSLGGLLCVHIQINKQTPIFQKVLSSPIPCSIPSICFIPCFWIL
jgi:hypothetical protein